MLAKGSRFASHPAFAWKLRTVVFDSGASGAGERSSVAADGEAAAHKPEFQMDMAKHRRGCVRTVGLSNFPARTAPEDCGVSSAHA